MPLIKSSSSKAVGENYKKEMESGKRKKTLEDAYARHIEENA